MKLTTVKKLKESAIEDKDAVVESSMNDGDHLDIAAVLEKQDSSPTTDTAESIASPHIEI